MNVWYTKQHVKKLFCSIWRVSYLGITGRKQYICVKNANTRWQSRRTCAHLLLQELQNYNSLLNTSTGECWLPQKRYSTSKAKGEAPIWWHFESNSMPTSDAWRAQKNFVHSTTQRPHRDWARPAFVCLSVSCGDTGHQWLAAGAGALGAADLTPLDVSRTYTACGISPLRGGHH